VTSTCGHACCGITGNPYHAHTHEPGTCRRCAETLGHRPVCTGTIVADVISRVAPEIPGLPGGADLIERVSAEVTAACAEARTDPELAGLDPAALHTAISGRVGIALAFNTSTVEPHG
jgi:hypothetical protein